MISRRIFGKIAGLAGLAARRAPLVTGAAAIAALEGIREARADQNYTSFAYNANNNGSAITGASARTSPTRWGDYYNVRDFGAVGDNSHDDTANIQACFDAAYGTAASPHGNSVILNKAVYFPAGTYKVTGPLRLTQVVSGRLFGDGMYNSFLQWSGSAYNGNTFPTTAKGTPNNAVSAMLELYGFGRSSISDMGFGFGNLAGDQFCACIYAFGGAGGCHGVLMENVSVGQSTFGVLMGPGELVSEWTYLRCEFSECGTAGAIIYGANTLNHDFICSTVGPCGNKIQEASFTGTITGTDLNVTTFSGTNKMPLDMGLRLYSTDGVVDGSTFITALAGGTGGTGHYTVSPSQTVSSRTIKAIYPVYGGIVNVSGSTPIIDGCDFADNPIDIYNGYSNPCSVKGVRTESICLLYANGTPVTVDACHASRGVVQWTCTSTGPILHVNSLSPGGFNVYPGMVVTGTDSTNTLPTAGAAVEPATRIIKQLTGTLGGTGDYLMTNQASPGDLTSCVVTGYTNFLYAVGSSAVNLNNCGGNAGAILVGSNNSVLRIMTNRFTLSGDITPNLLNLFYGQVLEYDVAADNGFTVANLPTPSTPLKGVRMFVTDSNISASAAFYTDINGHGGGTITVPVWCDGSAWRIG